MPTPLERWLADGEAPVADWPGYAARLANRGDLGFGPRGLLLDLPALAQPHACVPARCAPGLRAPGHRSCCADLVVGVTAEEGAAIVAALPEIEAWMATRDPRWAGGAPEVFEGGAVRRPGRRCVFAVRDSRGLTCALHAVEASTRRPRGALKPMPCRLFPLVLADLGDDHLLLTALGRPLGARFGLPPARLFPCLGGAQPRALVDEAAATIRELWGAYTLRRVRAAVRAWRAATAGG
jgi:hypothetical protein